jgi:hypothetical protein
VPERAGKMKERIRGGERPPHAGALHSERGEREIGEGRERRERAAPRVSISGRKGAHALIERQTERDRERERQRETERDTERDRQTDRQTERQKDRDREK